ncbi:MAG: hypothetical protein E6J71_05950 [Deltaproteobacteria bacterium]|nr:MAG: hypothetical protein E6J71_05950 [Deltaproteobacteria bacterium]
MNTKKLSMGLALCLGLAAGAAYAAQQGTAASTLLVKNTPSGTRKILYKAQNGSNTVVGNPVTNGTGATFNLQMVDGGTQTQCFVLPSSGWSAINTLGFKYVDPSLANGPVKSAQIKATPSGTFQIKVIAKGDSTSITVAPGNPTTSYATNFSIGAGDEYCGSTGTATPNPNDAVTFKVSHDDGTTCTLAACP